MPRYFFHIEDGLATRDDDGTELKDVSVAKCEAVKLAGQMICDSAASFWDRQEWKLTATNGDGLTLFCLHFIGIEAPAVTGVLNPDLISARIVGTAEEAVADLAPEADDTPAEGAN